MKIMIALFLFSILFTTEPIAHAEPAEVVYACTSTSGDPVEIVVRGEKSLIRAPLSFYRERTRRTTARARGEEGASAARDTLRMELCTLGSADAGCRLRVPDLPRWRFTTQQLFAPYLTVSLDTVRVNGKRISPTAINAYLAQCTQNENAN